MLAGIMMTLTRLMKKKSAMTRAVILSAMVMISDA